MKKLLISGILFLSSFSIFSQAKNNFTQQDYEKFFKESCIPKDLTGPGQVLLIQSPFEDSSKNNEINEIFKTWYKFPFIVVASDVKDFRKTYEDTKVYKYGVGFDKKFVDYGDNVQHPHYDLHLVDRVKTSKMTAPEPPKDPSKMSKKEQEKYLKDMSKNMDKYNIDLTAIMDTGLEDNESKLMKMLTFLAKKLGKYKEN